MRALVDKDTCTGCGLCVDSCPDAFEMEGDKAKPKGSVVPPGSEDCAREAEANCPVEAIKVSE